MRFSDMMGSGEERSSKRSGASESEALIADALAPYLDSVAPSAPATPSAPAAPTAPVPPVERPQVASLDPVAASAVDFTPISDDLLPRRR